MHELSVTESLLNLALQHLPNQPGTRIKKLYIVVGQLSSIVDDSVQFYWDSIAQNTPAAGAELNFRRLPAEFLCLRCNNRYPLLNEEWACPFCGSLQVKVISGEEFYLEAIDIEEPSYSPTSKDN